MHFDIVVVDLGKVFFGRLFLFSFFTTSLCYGRRLDSQKFPSRQPARRLSVY
jgi:hypothetical protein